MPRTPTSYNAIANDPLVTVLFQDISSKIHNFKIYMEVGSDTELSQRDFCGLDIALVSHRSPVRLRQHRGSKQCNKEKLRRRKKRASGEENLRTEVVEDTDHYRDTELRSNIHNASSELMGRVGNIARP
jgi:hypothetical protein